MCGGPEARQRERVVMASRGIPGLFDRVGEVVVQRGLGDPGLGGNGSRGVTRALQ